MNIKLKLKRLGIGLGIYKNFSNVSTGIFALLVLYYCQNFAAKTFTQARRQNFHLHKAKIIAIKLFHIFTNARAHDRLHKGTQLKNN